ncbi:transporter substrate-binding domain-containing protein [Citrobacter sp. Cpo126]|uniref:ATP-binding protein n=1 Tax=Citrobacter sp. Cpo126 TaxID=2985148 RepID=UPI002577EFD1|nr:transporter substrate-binding domain-containing protein [Citrobacter sp. Cpo126]MDM2774932.1 transporter substrate-binding domain-containing protein [Citrobacter sp. Cpo126]
MLERFFIFLMVIFTIGLSTGVSSARQVELKSNYNTSVQNIGLNREETNWLAHKKTLVVGTWLPEVSPIVYQNSGEYYRGVNADYLALMQKNLNLKIIIKQYDNEQEALAALANNDVDTLITQLSRRQDVGGNLLRTSALLTTWPTLVTSLKNTMLPLTSNHQVSVACVRDCPFLDVIQGAFPEAKVSFYDDEYQAMASVVNGDNQYYIGNNITSSHCISRYFSQSLVITHYFDKQEQYNYFVVNEDQPVLRNILDGFITSISNEIHMQVMQNWLNRGNLAYLNAPIPFTDQEKAWLKKKHVIRILINPDYSPYTLVDRSGELRGIIGDLLNIIHLQTGLDFEPILASSKSEQTKQISGEQWDMYPTITLTHQNPSNSAFSDPLMNVAFVMITSREETAESLLEKPIRIALPAGHVLESELKQRYPQATWVNADTGSVAMAMVKEGSVDAAIATELSARFMVDHYYQKNMHFFRLPDMPGASVSFAISPREPMLKSVMDKALQAIPPREILQMTERWSKISNTQVDFWSRYSKQFYQLGIFALLLIAISLIWGISLSREVNKRKQSQRLLEEQLHLKEALSQELENEKNKAIEATKAKSRFLASMSHELRTPVSSIVGFVELLSSSELSPAQRKEAIALTGATAQSLLGLIGKILDVDKIESGKYQVVPQWTDLSQLIELQCHSFDALARQKGITLACVSQLPANERVFVDQQALRQILTNLVGNALKFTEQGSIHVTARLTPEGENHGTLTIAISDTGCGISEEEQAGLFQRYAQGRCGRQQTGSGLGLFICKELVTLMGGTLELMSVPLQGTTFTITLPVETARQSIVSDGDAPGTLLPLPCLSILIADDNPTNRLLLKRQLNAIGYSVDEACDGEEAEAKLAKKSYDLLITDVNMPKKDGFDLAASLRRQQPNLQIWGLTASALPQSRDRCLQNGMNLCLFKPVSIQTLTHELSKIETGYASPCTIRHLKFNVLTENTGGDRALMNEILETFREATLNDIQAAEKAVLQDEPQLFLRALHRLHGSAQILGITALQNLCEPFESRRHDDLSLSEREEALQKIIAVMREIEIEIDSLISH